MQTVFLSDHNFASNEANLKFFFCDRKIQLSGIRSSAQIGLSCDIKSLFRQSIDIKLQIFTSIFHPVFLLFFLFILFHSTQEYLSISTILQYYVFFYMFFNFFYKGIVPKNEYGNVELFKPSMLPEGAVHLPSKSIKIVKE